MTEGEYEKDRVMHAPEAVGQRLCLPCETTVMANSYMALCVLLVRPRRRQSSIFANLPMALLHRNSLTRPVVPEQKTSRA